MVSQVQLQAHAAALQRMLRKTQLLEVGHRVIANHSRAIGPYYGFMDDFSLYLYPVS